MERTTEERLTSIEQRLSRIESKLNLPAPVRPAEPRIDPWGQYIEEAPARAPSAQEKPQGNWLGIIAILCFVLAAGFIIKLSIESGWLTPIRQVGLAALFGFGLIGAGMALVKADREYASLLPGAGIIVLYLTVFAAHRYYGLIPFETSIAATAFVSGLCIYLYTEFRHDVYPITAAAGAYAAPVIMGLDADAAFTIYYFLLCSFSFSVISIWVQSRLLTMVSAYFAIIMTASIGEHIKNDMLAACALALHFIIFSIGTWLYARQNAKPLTEDEASYFLPVLLVFYATEYYFLDRIHPGLAPWISLGFSGILIGLYLSAKQWFSTGKGSQALVVAFSTLVWFHSVYLEIIPEDIRPWLFIIILMARAFPPVPVMAEGESKSVFYLPTMALIAIMAIEYMRILMHVWSGDSAYWLVISMYAFASIWIAMVFAKEEFSGDTGAGRTLLGAAHVLAVVAFYRLAHGYGSLAVSVSWLVYAICVIMFAFGRRDETIAKSALYVLAFAAGKALLYDASSAPTLVRILCLLVTGAALYGSGFFLRKIASWTSAEDSVN